MTRARPADRLLDGTLSRVPGRGPGRGVQAVQERGELGQAQPPGGQLGGGDQPAGTVMVRTRTWLNPAASARPASRSASRLTQACQAGSR